MLLASKGTICKYSVFSSKGYFVNTFQAVYNTIYSESPAFNWSPLG